jgi:hypothetical protein
MDNPNDAGIYFSKNCINYKTIWTLRENERVWPDLRERKKEYSVSSDLDVVFGWDLQNQCNKWLIPHIYINAAWWISSLVLLDSWSTIKVFCCSTQEISHNTERCFLTWLLLGLKFLWSEIGSLRAIVIKARSWPPFSPHKCTDMWLLYISLQMYQETSQRFL